MSKTLVFFRCHLCDFASESKAGLYCHQRVHGFRHLVKGVVLTNECPFCFQISRRWRLPRNTLWQWFPPAFVGRIGHIWDVKWLNFVRWIVLFVTFKAARISNFRFTSRRIALSNRSSLSYRQISRWIPPPAQPNRPRKMTKRHRTEEEAKPNAPPSELSTEILIQQRAQQFFRDVRELHGHQVRVFIFEDATELARLLRHTYENYRDDHEDLPDLFGGPAPHMVMATANHTLWKGGTPEEMDLLQRHLDDFQAATMVE